MVGIFKMGYKKYVLAGIAKNEIAAKRYLMKQQMNFPGTILYREKHGIETKDPYLMTPKEVEKYYEAYVWAEYIFEKIDIIH